MPCCNDCKWLVDGEKCGIGHHKPLRNCIIAIMREYCELLQPHHNVLEVGCGAWSPVRDRAAEIGCRWEGIDVSDNYGGKPTIATKLASVDRIPFDDKEFDFVLSTQSMELWEEHGVDLLKGISEIFRVLKPGGWALINVPIHYHGGYLFVLGKLDSLRRMFERFSDEIIFEPWRNPPHPLPQVRYHLKLYWHKPSLWNKSGYVLDIRACRTGDVPYFDNPRLGFWHKAWKGMVFRGPFFYLTVVIRFGFRYIFGRRGK